jgi:hypothetical protein
MPTQAYLALKSSSPIRNYVDIHIDITSGVSVLCVRLIPNSGGRGAYGVRLLSLDCWDPGFESR